MKIAPSTGHLGPVDHLDAGTLFERHAKFVARFLLRLGVPRPDLDDAVQEVFLVAHRRGGFAPGRARPTTWLAEIALRVAIRAKRTERRRMARPDDPAISVAVGEAPSADARMEAAQALRRVEIALAAMDLAHRAVFMLYEIEGEPCDAIAAALGVPLGTVHSRLHKARRIFVGVHARLEAREQGPGAWPAGGRP